MHLSLVDISAVGADLAFIYPGGLTWTQIYRTLHQAKRVPKTVSQNFGQNAPSGQNAVRVCLCCRGVKTSLLATFIARCEAYVDMPAARTHND